MTRPLRIMPFLHSFEAGGVERVALRLSEAWARAGADVKLVLGRTDGALREGAPDLDYLTLPSGAVPTARFETLWMMRCLRKQVIAHRPDVLFCAGNTYAVVAAALRLMLGAGCPPIVAKISNDLERRDLPAPVRAGYRQWLRLQARFIDRFVGMAEPMRGEIAAATGLAPASVAIIEDPALSQADLAAHARRPCDADASAAGLRFVAAGRLARQKNFALLLRAFALGAGPRDRLTVVGDGPARAALGKLADCLGIAGRVDFPGHVADIAAAFGRCDVFVLSSDYEGVPAVIIEALASGLPIVATDCSVSMAALLGGGRLGRLVPVGDVQALAAALRAAPQLRQDRDAARQVAARFTVECAAERYLSLFAGVAGTSPALASLAPAAVRAGVAG